MRRLSSVLLLSATVCQAFMPMLPASQKLATSTTRRLSVQLPTQEPSVIAPEQQQQQQQQQSLVEEQPILTEKPKQKAKGPAPVVVLEGDILESTTEHRLIVGAHYVASAIALSQITSDLSISSWQEGGALAGLLAFSLLFSDLFSGVFHWSVDNYGNGKTPLLGGVIEAFQGHHDAPWTITHREFSNNVHKICKITTPAILALSFMHPEPHVALFGVLFFNFQVLSQEFHKLSHLTKPPVWATTLQDLGLIISRKEHGQHHSSPFESNYCILTGTCNSFLDKSGFFRHLERIVYEATGVEPNCWRLGPEIKAAALATGRQE